MKMNLVAGMGALLLSAVWTGCATQGTAGNGRAAGEPHSSVTTVDMGRPNAGMHDGSPHVKLDPGPIATNPNGGPSGEVKGKIRCVLKPGSPGASCVTKWRIGN